MSVAAILRRAGFGPQHPQPSPRAGDAETVVPQRLPKIPNVPAQKDKVENVGSEKARTRLLALAEAEGMNADLVHGLTSADVHECAALPDATLRAFLHARQDTADREAGRLPASYTARALCCHCGPVWLPPAHVTDAPTVGDWPRVLGCPWCHVHLPDNMAMPRPPVTSATCAHFTPDTMNPDAGMGHCAYGHHYPGQRHTCTQYQPKSTP